jgi:hypothetical protein
MAHILYPAEALGSGSVMIGIGTTSPSGTIAGWNMGSRPSNILNTRKKFKATAPVPHVKTPIEINREQYKDIKIFDRKAIFLGILSIAATIILILI